MSKRENELLKQENARLQQEMHALTNSKAYKLGTLVRVVVKNPKKAAKKVVTVGLRNPKNMLRSVRSATNNVVQFTIKQTDLDTSYQAWRLWNDPTPEELDKQRSDSKKFKKKPVISIITPVFKPPVDVLTELIESVLAQTYPYFELCMVEVAGDMPTRELLTAYSKKDKRIKIKFYDKNGGISEDSNRCIKLATGEYIGLLDHDDLISPNALYENVKMINSDDYDFLYSDKDKITEGGERYEPLFKPQWSPEMMYNANYLTHFNVFKHSLLKKIGGWHSDTNGAQDWDLFLRLIQASKKVGHIPKILYHWRVLKTSTAHSITTKPYALLGQRNAVERGALAEGVTVVASHNEHGVLHISWEKQNTSKKLTILLVTVEDTDAASKKQKLTKSLHAYDLEILTVSQQNGVLMLKAITDAAKKDRAVLVMHEYMTSIPTAEQVQELAGWLEIKDVCGVTPHIVSKQDAVLFDPGRLFGFQAAFGPYYSGSNYMPHVFGFKEWVRNISANSPYFSMFYGSKLQQAAKSLHIAEDETVLDVFWKLHIALRLEQKRFVSTPYVTVEIDTSKLVAEPVPSEAVTKLLIEKFAAGDSYFNSNLSLTKSGPQLIEPKHKKQVLTTLKDNYGRGVLFQGTRTHTDIQDDPELTQFQSDSLALSALYDFTEQDILTSKAITKNARKMQTVETVIWFIPVFTTLYAGLKNIFAFADTLQTTEGSRNIFAFNTQDDISVAKQLAIDAFPSLADADFLTYDQSTISSLPESSVAVCTLWTTAYDVLKYNNTSRKCYMIQDWEPEFYPRGSIAALAAETYSFGYYGLAGTRGLYDLYKKNAPDAECSVLPSLLDLSSYLKSSSRSKRRDDETRRVLFYARPDTPRNAFELGLNALTVLKKQMGDSVEIVLAGADVSSELYDLEARGITAAGKVPYDQLGSFYASFDVCLFLMYSEHPGVIPLEMMASRVPVVVNDHSNSTWDDLYVHEKTCLRSRSSASEIARNLKRILDDSALADRLVNSGVKVVATYDEREYVKQAKATILSIKKGSA